MTTQSHPTAETETSIPSTTQLGYVHLTVSNLEEQIRFYQEVLGMQLHWRDQASASLGAGEADLLRLTEVKQARRVPHTTGLYHFAVLYPSRKELARVIARLFTLRYPNYPTDHIVSETTYLDDPEGQTIELYIRTLDRGTVEQSNGEITFRRYDGKPTTGRDPLDLESLMSELTPDEGVGLTPGAGVGLSPGNAVDLPMPKGTKLGHMHLYASSLSRSMHFYHDILGFQRGPMSTSFRMGEVGLSADQPHVIAFNTWQGENSQPPPPNSLGIRYFTIRLPGQAELDHVLERLQHEGIAMEATGEGTLVRDPSGIGVVLTIPPKA